MFWRMAGLFIASPFFMLLWSYFSVVLTDPGSVSPNWRPAVDEQRGEADPLNGSKFSGLQPDPSNQRIRYCQKCHQLKPVPPRCHHLFCGQCVLKMDHHCVWVVNCVGAVNYKYFLLILVTFRGPEAARRACADLTPN